MAEGRDGIIAVMADVTQILWQIESGDATAAEQLLPLVYEELRKPADAGRAAANVVNRTTAFGFTRTDLVWRIAFILRDSNA